jgi:hypothetical protein
VFQSRSVSETSAVFENSGHDFPQRIGYQRAGSDSLLAWIEGTVDGRVRRVQFVTPHGLPRAREDDRRVRIETRRNIARSTQPSTSATSSRLPTTGLPRSSLK